MQSRLMRRDAAVALRLRGNPPPGGGGFGTGGLRYVPRWTPVVPTFTAGSGGVGGTLDTGGRDAGRRDASRGDGPLGRRRYRSVQETRAKTLKSDGCYRRQQGRQLMRFGVVCGV